jgi:hypothetical protein
MDATRRATLIDAAVEAQSYPPEAALARDWLTANIDSFDDIEWQKRVGTGVRLGPEYSPEIQKMAANATRKRVDLVGYKGNQTTLVELKQNVDLAAVRQAAQYAELWRIAPTTPPVAAVLVVGRTGDPDIQAIAAAHGVTVELIALFS